MAYSQRAMSPSLEELEQQVMALPPEQRARLVDKLWESLGDTTVPYLSDEWRAELERRRRELDEGKVTVIPGDEVMRKARERVKAASRR